MYRNLKLTCEGRLARVVLDRPERRNAFSADLMREMIAAPPSWPRAATSMRW